MAQKSLVEANLIIFSIDTKYYVNIFFKHFHFPKMKALEKEEKDRIKFLFAVGLYKAMKVSSIKSYRQLATLAGMEQSHMQKIAVGKNDATHSTIVAISTAFQMTYSEFATFYDSVSENDIVEFKDYLEKQKKTYGSKRETKGG